MRTVIPAEHWLPQKRTPCRSEPAGRSVRAVRSEFAADAEPGGKPDAGAGAAAPTAQPRLLAVRLPEAVMRVVGAQAERGADDNDDES
jgi:hypothetical protein